MANITKARTGEILRKIFEILLDEPEGLPAKEIIARAARELTLSDFEKSDYPNRPGVRRFEKIARFATIGPVKAGWLEKSSGLWRLTPEGIAAYRAHPDPADFLRESDRIYREWAADQPVAEEDAALAENSSSAIATLEEAEENAWAEIQEHLAEMPPYDFQEIVAGLLKAMGYHVSFVSPPGPDQGIDVIAHTDPLGISGPRIKVQVKRRADKTNVEGIRSFLALLGEGDAGIYVNIGGFTSEAEREARQQERRKLMLVDSRRLLELWIEQYTNLDDAVRRFLPIKPVYFLNLTD